jgi:hypothetical protein
MNRFYLVSAAVLSFLTVGCNYNTEGTNPAGEREADATRKSMNAADREVGMPRMVNFAQKKLLKNAYEDMDQTTLTYAYTQGMDGRMICLGQALGYGVSLGTQFTASHYPQRITVPYADGTYPNTYGDIYEQDQPEPNGLYSPTSGDATIVDLINPKNGEAHTALIESKVNTVPFELPAAAVSVPCPEDVDPKKVKDVKEESLASQLGDKSGK